jgi:beta-glucosidase/6-phospho-beta-glucosidase/beta-galactosidase
MGWGQRFGLVHVDYQPLNRTVKDSGWWYREWIAGGTGHEQQGDDAALLGARLL